VLRAAFAVSLVAALVSVGGLLYANSKRREAEDRCRDALAAGLTSQAQSILAGGQPGSTAEAIVKVLAAQDISKTPERGALLTTLNRTAGLRSVVDAPNGRFLSAEGTRVATTTDAGIQLLDTTTGDPVGRPLGNSQDAIYGSSPDGRYLALVNEKLQTRVWDSVTGQPIGRPVGNSSRSPRAVSPDGHRVAYNSDEGVQLWDVSTGQPLGRPFDGGAAGTALRFSPDGRRLATNTVEGRVRLSDANTAAEIGQPLAGGAPHEPSVMSIAFSPDARTVAATTKAWPPARPVAALQVWNADTGAAIGPPVTADDGAMLAMAFSPDGSRIVTGGADKAVRFWDARTGQPSGEPIALQDQVSDVAFTQRGDRIVAVSGDTVQIHDADAELVTDTPASRTLQTDSASSVFGAWPTTAGPRILVRDDNVLRLLNADTGERVGAPVHNVPSNALVDLSADGRRLAIWSSAGEEIRIVDALSGAPYGASPIRPGAAVKTAKFSPGGQSIAVACADNTLGLWDLSTGRQVRDPISAEPVRTLQFSQDGHRLLAGSQGSLRVWDVATGETIGKPISGVGSGQIAISPDGRRVAAADGTAIDQWEVEGGSAVGAQMRGHTIGINSIAYGPDGDYLVSTGSDGTLRFWDTPTGRQLGDAILTPGEQESVDVAPDGRRIFISQAAALTPEGPVGSRVSELPGPAVWRERLCAKLARNPTEEQWRQWISSDIGYLRVCPDKP